MKIGINRQIIVSLLAFSLSGIFLWPSVSWAADISAGRIIDETNAVRAEYGLAPLVYNKALEAAAKAKAESIFKTQTFGHNLGEKKFSDWVRETGYKYAYVGENLAIDFVRAEAIMDAWFDSPTHRKNLLSGSFSEIGVAVAAGEFEGINTTLVVQIFARPLPVFSPESDKLPELPAHEKQASFNTTADIHDSALLTHVLVTAKTESAAKAPNGFLYNFGFLNDFQYHRPALALTLAYIVLFALLNYNINNRRRARASL